VCTTVAPGRLTGHTFADFFNGRDFPDFLPIQLADFFVITHRFIPNAKCGKFLTQSKKLYQATVPLLYERLNMSYYLVW
jgi:hypothetical protein